MDQHYISDERVRESRRTATRALRRALLMLVFSIALGASLSAHASFHSFDCHGGISASDTANGRTNPVPCVEAHRITNGGIVIDGTLDDAAWDHAEPATGFQQWDPERGGEASEETVFKVAYDDEALYVGVACFQSDPNSIASQMCRRDHLHSSDVISLYLDTYHDKTTGYNFRVNPYGSIEDRHVSNNGDMDRNWDAVRRAEAEINDQGWSAEMRIPFSCVRFRPGESITCGCNLYRYMHERGEDTAWVVWDRELSGFVNRFGQITGLSGLRCPRQIELLPYAVHRSTDPAATGDEDKLDHLQNVGLDLKYGVTSDLVLNATVQPDFGQVEADPALLNLSPFETYYDEKRPFFTEGNRFFSHPEFNMFYSRRIGTGEENSRIRAAAKLTGKTPSGISIAALYAATDVTGDGQAHNLFKSGEQRSHYIVGRFGKESSDGNHRFNLMQTAVYRTADRDSFGHYASRDAWTSGADFDLNFLDRDYGIRGSVVGSIVDPAPLASDPGRSHGPSYGSGGTLSLRKQGGTIRGGVFGRWETERLDLNDVGFLSAPDETHARAWVFYLHSSTNEDALFKSGNLELEAGKAWLYGDGSGYDVESEELAWSYDRGHPHSADIELDGWGQFQNFWSMGGGIGWQPDGTSKYATRTYDDRRGPLMSIPSAAWGWWGLNTDHRKDFTLSHDGNYSRSESGARNLWLSLGGEWNVSSAVNVSLWTSYGDNYDDAQHLENFYNPGGGIGGVS